jgi:prevent-host-death family protein
MGRFISSAVVHVLHYCLKLIPQRELRNDIGRVLREVEAGERLRITVDGRPVADLVPIAGTPRTFVSRADVTQLLGQVALDGAFMRDIDRASGDTIDEL